MDVLTCASAVGRVRDMLRSGGGYHIVTVNPEMVVLASREPAFRAVLERASLLTVDGVGVALALRYLYRLVVARVTGVELLLALARCSARDLTPVYLLGAAPGVAEAAAARLKETDPGLVVAGVFAGSPDCSQDEPQAAMIRSSGARVLFVAFGTPAQEYWIRRNLPALGDCVAVGVGGSFDYIAGVVPRAPGWMRAAGLEWLYRLARQPWRWRRQLALPIFVYLVARQAMGRYRGDVE